MFLCWYSFLCIFLESKVIGNKSCVTFQYQRFEFTDDDGSFRTENGIEDTKDGEITWISPEGEQVSISYVADENGYKVSGSHLPQNVPLPDGSPDGPGGSRNNLSIWSALMQQG